MPDEEAVWARPSVPFENDVTTTDALEAPGIL